MTISGVSWQRGYSRERDGDQEMGGILSSHSARVRGRGALLILSASGREVLGTGEDMVMEHMMTGVG